MSAIERPSLNEGNSRETLLRKKSVELKRGEGARSSDISF
jgi:hypothetical protein